MPRLLSECGRFHRSPHFDQQQSFDRRRNDDDWDQVHNDWLEVQRKEREVSENTTDRKIDIAPPDAQNEIVADDVARKVVQGDAVDLGGMSGAGGSTIQPSGEGVPETPGNFGSQLNSSKGNGAPLNETTQAELGGKMNADFSDVKIHTGAEAGAMAESINAKAFTHGQDIYFGQGHYNPQAREGKELLAHELVHTQQNTQQHVAAKIQRQPHPHKNPVTTEYFFKHGWKFGKTPFGEASVDLKIGLKKDGALTVKSDDGKEKIRLLKASYESGKVNGKVEDNVNLSLASGSETLFSFWGDHVKVEVGFDLMNLKVTEEELSASLLKINAKISGEMTVEEFKDTPAWTEQLEAFNNQGYKIVVQGSISYSIRDLGEIRRLKKLSETVREQKVVTEQMEKATKDLDELYKKRDAKKKELFEKFKKDNKIGKKEYQHLSKKEKKAFDKFLHSEKEYKKVLEGVEKNKKLQKALVKRTKALAKVAESIGSKMSTKLGKLLGKRLMKQSAKFLSKFIPFVDIAMFLYDLAVLIKFRDHLSLEGGDSPELWDDVPEEDQKEGTEEGDNPNGNPDGTSDTKSTNQNGTQSDSTSTGTDSNGTGNNDKKTDNTDSTSTGNKDKTTTTSDSTHTDQKSDNTSSDSTNTGQHGDPTKKPDLTIDDINDRFSKEGNPVKRIIFDAVITEFPGVEVDKDLLERFIALNYGGLMPQSEELKRILDRIKAEGTPITDKEALLKKLQEILDNKEKEQKPNDNSTNTTSTNTDTKTTDKHTDNNSTNTNTNTDKKDDTPPVLKNQGDDSDKKDKKEVDKTKIDVIQANAISTMPPSTPNTDIAVTTFFLMSESSRFRTNEVVSVVFRFYVPNLGKYDIKGCKVRITAIGNDKRMYVEMADNFSISLPNGRTILYEKGATGSYPSSKIRYY